MYCSIETMSSPVSWPLCLGGMAGDVVVRCCGGRVVVRKGAGVGGRGGGGSAVWAGKHTLSDSRSGRRPANLWGTCPRPPKKMARLFTFWLGTVRVQCACLLKNYTAPRRPTARFHSSFAYFLGHYFLFSAYPYYPLYILHAACSARRPQEQRAASIRP